MRYHLQTLQFKHLTLLILIIFSIDTFAQSNFNRQNPITSVQEIYTTEFPYELRKILDSYSTLDSHKPQDRKKIEHLAQYISHHHNHKNGEVLKEMMSYINIFSEKFFVLEIKKYKNGKGCKAVGTSYRINVLFSFKKLERFQFLIYKNRQNKYEICGIYWENMTDFKDIEYAKLKKYRKYWL